MNHEKEQEFLEKLEVLKYDEQDPDVAELIDRTIDITKWIWRWMYEMKHKVTTEEEFSRWLNKKLEL